MSEGLGWKKVAAGGCGCLAVVMMGFVLISALGFCGLFKMGNQMNASEAKLDPDAFGPMVTARAELFFDALVKGDADAAIASTPSFLETLEGAKDYDDHIKENARAYAKEGVAKDPKLEEPNCKQMFHDRDTKELVFGEDPGNARLMGLICTINYELVHDDTSTSAGVIAYMGMAEGGLDMASEDWEPKVVLYQVNHKMRITKSKEPKGSRVFEAYMHGAWDEIGLLYSGPDVTGAAPEIACESVHVTRREHVGTRLSGDAANRRYVHFEILGKEDYRVRARIRHVPDDSGRPRSIVMQMSGNEWVGFEYHRRKNGEIYLTETFRFLDETKTRTRSALQEMQYEDDERAVIVRYANLEDDGSVDEVGMYMLRYDEDGDVTSKKELSLSKWHARHNQRLNRPTPLISYDAPDGLPLNIKITTSAKNPDTIVALVEGVRMQDGNRMKATQRLFFQNEPKPTMTWKYGPAGTAKKKRLLEHTVGDRKEVFIYDDDAILSLMKITEKSWSATRKYTYEKGRLSGFTITEPEAVKSRDEIIDAAFTYDICPNGDTK